MAKQIRCFVIKSRRVPIDMAAATMASVTAAVVATVIAGESS
jgi:hypothetical protein